MKSRHLLGLTGCLFFLLGVVTGQDVDPDSNWFKEVRGVDDSYSRFDLARYTLKDVGVAKQRYVRIEQQAAEGEWEGVYTTHVGIGTAELRWRSTQGFVFHQVYHTLAALDYGGVTEGVETVRLTSKRSGRRQRSPLFADALVKAKVGKKHYLVPLSRLKDFAERAVGREVSHMEEWHYWWKIDEGDLTVAGPPVLPARYAHLVVPPIQATILRVGRRQVVPSSSTTNEVNYDDIYISVTLAGGNAKGLRPGMDLFVPDLGEWVEIMKVRKFDSLGRIRRDFSLDGQEECWDSEEGTGNPFPCKTITKGLVAFTRPDDSF